MEGKVKKEVQSDVISFYKRNFILLVEVSFIPCNVFTADVTYVHSLNEKEVIKL